MRSPEHLLALQRRFAAALREPLWGESRAATELPAGEASASAAFLETAATAMTPSGSLAATERLELYHRQYWYRLLDSLAEDFPSLRRHLGEQAFWRLLEAYLERRPPRSATLRHLGEGLADFLAAEPGASLHAVELARVEYALCLAFEAAELPAATAADLAGGAIALQPHLQRFAFHTAADRTWRQPTRAPTPATARPARYVAVFREGEALRVERLARAAFRILEALEATGSLDQAMAQLATGPERLRPRDLARVRSWFATWTARRWLGRPTPHDGDRP